MRPLTGNHNRPISLAKENKMTPRQFVRAAVTVAAALAAVVLGGMVISSTRARAQEEDVENSRIQIGFEIAPVPLNLSGKNRELVGLGSYIVNAQADCNGCHSAGSRTAFVDGGVPFFGPGHPLKVNPATYLGGGLDFVPPPFSGLHTSSRAI